MRKLGISLWVFMLFVAGIANGQNFEVSKVVPLTDGTEKFSEPKWSPSGEQIAFTKSGHEGIYLMRTDGTGTKQLVDDLGAGYKFQWSPNGKKIAYRGTKFEGNKRKQFIAEVEVQSQNKKVLSAEKPRIDNLPVYDQAEGKEKLVLVQDEGIEELIEAELKSKSTISTACVDVIFKKGDLFTVYHDGTMQQITKNGRSVYPVLSPDKSKVVYSYNDQLIVVNVDGSNPMNLGKGYHPSFSPDGKYIVYHIATDDGYTITSSDLYIIGIDGKNKVQLTNTPDVIEEYPDWSPKGKAIVFNGLNSGKLYKLELK